MKIIGAGLTSVVLYGCSHPSPDSPPTTVIQKGPPDELSNQSNLPANGSQEGDTDELSQHKEEKLREWINNQSALGFSLPVTSKFKAYIAGNKLAANTGNPEENERRGQKMLDIIGDHLSYYGHMTPEGELKNLFNGKLKAVDEKYLLFDLNSDLRRFFVEPNQLTSLAVNLAPRLFAHIRHGIRGIPQDGLIVLDWQDVTGDSLHPGNIQGSDVMIEHLLRLARRRERWDRVDNEAVITGPYFRQQFMDATGDNRLSAKIAFIDIVTQNPDDNREGGRFFQHPTFYPLDTLYKKVYASTFTGHAFLNNPPAPANQIITIGTVGNIVRYGLLPLGEPLEISYGLVVRQPVVCALFEPLTKNLTGITALNDLNTVTQPNTYFWTPVWNVGVPETPYDEY